MMQGELQNLREDAVKEKAEAERARIEQENKTNVVAETIDSLKSALTIPELIDLAGQYGLAPAASKVYKRDRGLSIGGYGEIVFWKPTTNRVRTSGGVTVDQTRSDAQRLILYAGYKFNDGLVFNSEIEFEHGTTDPTVTQGSRSGSQVRIPNALTTIWEAHGQWRWRGIEARSVFAASWLSDAGELTTALREASEFDADETIANQMLGVYAEVGYNVLP